MTRHHATWIPIVSVWLGGCYLSHELPICTYDVPEEERCLAPPEGTDPAGLIWLGASFLHRDPRAGCIAVSIGPTMLEHRRRFEDAIALIEGAACAPCFEPMEVVPSHLLPPGPRIHLAPDGACEEAGPTGTGCWSGVDACRGTLTGFVLSRSEDWSLDREWTTEDLAATALISFGIQSVSHDEVRRALSGRLERLLCAVHPPDEPWCPGS